MARNTIRLVVILGTISIVGIVAMQVYWVSKALDDRRMAFDQEVRIALRKVAEQNANYTQTSLPHKNLINQISPNYYVVNVNSALDANVLEHFLRNELINSHLNVDFEYGIYDCGSDNMVYGNWISKTENRPESIGNQLPKWKGSDFYFGVRFPQQTMYWLGQIDVWLVLSAVLSLVVVFFGYTLFAILKQKRLAEVQKDFINNMTHEFKTPISTIHISANVLSKPEIIQQPERLLNYVTIIQRENSRLQNQVEKVLQMTQTENKFLKLNREHIDLHELITKTARSFEVKIKEQNGTLSLDLGNFEAWIEADLLHLSNILYNLLDNALKYSGEKKPEITIQTQIFSKKLFKKAYFLLKIIDQGVGIGKEHQKMIFDKFFRVPTGNLHNVKGFGIGLYYVHTMVEAHKWRIWVNSEIDKGSTFGIEIPIS